MRMMFMAYVADSIAAVDFYCRAFSAKAQNCFKHADEDSFYAHAEIVVNDQSVLAISDIAHYGTDFLRGNHMQFWLDFDDEAALKKAYAVLSENARIHTSPGPGGWCKTLADLTDQYAVRWLMSYRG